MAGEGLEENKNQENIPEINEIIVKYTSSAILEQESAEPVGRNLQNKRRINHHKLDTQKEE